MDWLRSTLPVMPDTIPYQQADLDTLAFTLEEVAERVWLVTANQHYGGHLAISAMLRLQPHAGWRFLGWILATPPFATAAAVGYSFIARIRHRLPGGTPACTAPLR